MVDLLIEPVKAEADELFKIEVCTCHAAVAVAHARTGKSFRRHIAVALRKFQFNLARSVFLVPIGLHSLQSIVLRSGDLTVLLTSHVCVQKFMLVKVIRVNAADLRGKAHKVVLIAARDAVVFIHRH